MNTFYIRVYTRLALFSCEANAKNTGSPQPQPHAACGMRMMIHPSRVLAGQLFSFCLL
jgi:hypothetical protein